MTWRETARPIIAEVIQKHRGQPEEVIKKALSEVYPFGERKYFPYKVWLDEIKVQLGKRKFGAPHMIENKDQLNLF